MYINVCTLRCDSVNVHNTLVLCNALPHIDLTQEFVYHFIDAANALCYFPLVCDPWGEPRILDYNCYASCLSFHETSNKLGMKENKMHAMRLYILFCKTISLIIYLILFEEAMKYARERFSDFYVNE